MGVKLGKIGHHEWAWGRRTSERQPWGSAWKGFSTPHTRWHLQVREGGNVDFFGAYTRTQRGSSLSVTSLLPPGPCGQPGSQPRPMEREAAPGPPSPCPWMGAGRAGAGPSLSNSATSAASCRTSLPWGPQEAGPPPSTAHLLGEALPAWISFSVNRLHHSDLFHQATIYFRPGVVTHLVY